MNRLVAVGVFVLLAISGFGCGQSEPPSTEAQLPTSAPTSIATEIPSPAEPASPTDPATASVATKASTPPPAATSTAAPTPTPAPTSIPTAIPTSTPLPTPAPATVAPPQQLTIETTLVPLGDNLQWVAFFDNRTQGWSYYDPSGSFTVESVIPLSPPGVDVPGDLAAFGSITELAAGSVYFVAVSRDQSVAFGSNDFSFNPGVNFVVWLGE